ncbi:MAG TPA: PDZ domain-containing protein [Verrucomicrobiae bacterium]|nr:PDZ domain-containing protein [Verrucomicrobiae bacterium]
MFICLLAAGVVAVLWQQQTVSRLRDENRELSIAARDTERLRKENEQRTRTPADTEEIESLRKDNQEIHKLRNEVRQLREQQKELETLRTENQRLRALAANRPAPPPAQSRVPVNPAPVQARGPLIGVSMSQFIPADNPDLGTTLKQGVVIQSVVENGPAANAGIQPGDIVTAVDGRPISTPQQLREEIAPRPDGQTVILDVVRSGQAIKAAVQVARRP